MKIITNGAKVSIAQGLFIVCLPFLFLTASLTWAINTLWIYQHGFEKYNISTTTGLAQEELEKAARGLINYFNSSDEYINLTIIKDGQLLQLFNQREISHLKDVKGLFRLNYRVLLGTVAYALVYKFACIFWRRGKYRQRLARNVVSGSILTLILMLVMGMGALLGDEQFARFFLQFHLISFTNDLWLLDPTKDYLLMLFPQGFWFDTTRFVALATTGMAIVFGGLAGGFLFLKYQSQQQQSNNNKSERETKR